jgi:hypothetical protein
MIYMDIDKSMIPYSFEMDIKDEEFTFVVDYNQRFDFFTMDLYKNGELLIKGEKIIYGRALFGGYPDADAIPQWPITPFDEAGLEDQVGWDQLGNTVFLFIGDDPVE